MKALLVICALASVAHADGEAWYQGKYARNRIIHMSIVVAAGGAYIATETFLKPHLAQLQCNWCAVDSVDESVRNALVWRNTNSAKLLSNLDGYVAAPLFSLGMTLAGSLTSDDPSWARVIDDGIPVLETVLLAEVFDQGIKFSVGRQRPYAHFNPPATPDLEDNVSFFSAHSALVFGLATSAVVIAHRRHYWTEPYIWIGGGVLALSTVYFRMAADQHYLSDIATGATIGIVSGIFVPKLMDRYEVVPTSNGAAVAGQF